MLWEATASLFTTIIEPFEHASTCAAFQAVYSSCSRASVRRADFALFQVAGGTVPRMLPPAVAPPLEPVAAPPTSARGEPVPPPECEFLLPAPALAPWLFAGPKGVVPLSALPASPHAGKRAEKSANSDNSTRIVIE